MQVGKVNKGVAGKRGRWKKFDLNEFDSKEEVKFIGAVGDEGSKGAALGLSFQVADVRKPLLAVTRIAEKGNVVQFGPSEGDNFIRNKLSGNKILLRKKEGRTSWMYRSGKMGRSGLRSLWIVQLKNQFAHMHGEISLGLMGWSKS